MALSVGKRVTTAIGAATLLAAAGFLAMPNLAKAADETFSLVGVIPIPGLASFDISWVSNTGFYFLADRSNKSIDIYNISAGTVTNNANGKFVGAVGTPVNNDISGPNGVLTLNNTASGAGPEIWVGDGPQVNAGCPSYLSGSCSTTKVISGTSGGLTHVIPTNGAARADELCHDGVDNVVLIANDAEAGFSFGTPFITFISTATYKVIAQMSFPQATNGIEQCQYDATTGLFFLNLPEVNGPGNDTADGQVVVISPPTAANKNTPKVVANYIIPTVDCAGPQGMAVGPEPQLLLGCNAAGPNGVQNSLIINKHTGAVLAIGWGIGGADEVWFNPGDNHYFVTGSSLPTPGLAVVDAVGSGEVDQIIPTPKIAGASPHSVAADPTTNQVFIPTAGGVNIFAASAPEGSQ